MSSVISFYPFPRAALACLLTVSLLGCGGGDSAEEAERSADAAQNTESHDAEATPPASAPPADQSGATAPLTVEDIERWEKGMAGELQAVQTAAAKLKSARSGEDTLTGMMAVQENATQEQGAQAAGVELERYKLIRSNLSAAASYLAPQVGGIDTAMLSPAQRDEMRQANETQLKQLEAQVPPDVIEALRPRAAELRKQSLELAGARLKAAGM